ncbi:uncharacterized protein TEOVI_000652500 [Trypanosoma equiperdum]|uniref:Uncharacterized protein n=1 Tax=Trypanosoma equiperdum TaxID=5694 RepID=A0A1G4HZA2_TRYEQ|nr:hypothetical protein, conserved [Trypanosoma equiperdum]
MVSWFWTTPSASTPMEVHPVLSLEERVRRVTADDLARVTPSDVQRVKQRLTKEDLHRAMRIMLEDDRYQEVMMAAPSTSLRKASDGLDSTHRRCFTSLARRNMLAFYNVLPHITESHLKEVYAPFEGVSE